MLAGPDETNTVSESHLPISDQCLTLAYLNEIDFTGTYHMNCSLHLPTSIFTAFHPHLSQWKLPQGSLPHWIISNRCLPQRRVPHRRPAWRTVFHRFLPQRTMTKLKNCISQIPTSKNRTSQMTNLKNSISQTPTSKDSTSHKTNLKNCILQSLAIMICISDTHPKEQHLTEAFCAELCLVNSILQMPTSRNRTYQKPALMTCISQMPTWRNAL